MTLPLIRPHICLNWLVSEEVCQCHVNFTQCDIMFTWNVDKNAIKAELVLSFHGMGLGMRPQRLLFPVIWLT